MSDDDLTAIRDLLAGGPANTHYDGCHRSHPRCAAAALLAECDRLRAALAAERERAAGVCDGLKDNCLALADRQAARQGFEQAEWLRRRASALAEAAAAIRRGPAPEAEKATPAVQGDWGHLPAEPCRYCRQVGGVHFLRDDGPEGRDGHQVTRCDKCGRSWEAGAATA